VVESGDVIIRPFVGISASEDDQVKADVPCIGQGVDVANGQIGGGKNIFGVPMERGGEATLLVHPGEKLLMRGRYDTDFHFNAPVY
jgi:hypothetical protein